MKLSQLKPASSRTLESLRGFRDFSEVPWGEYRSSIEIPLVSCGYMDCRPTVITNDKVHTLAHFYSDTEVPTTYVDAISQDLRTATCNLTALVIGGRNASKIEDYCRSKGMNVLDLGFSQMFVTEPRDVITLPMHKHIYVHCSNGTNISVDLSKGRIDNKWSESDLDAYTSRALNVFNIA